VLLAVVATVGVTLLGVVLGVLAGVRGGVIDAMIMRLVDVIQALPFLLIVIAVIALVGSGTRNLLAAIILFGWAGYARVVRSTTLSIRERDFVGASHALGASRSSTTIRHIVPNLLGPVIVLSTLDLGRMLLTLSTLSFLGVGVRPPTPEWGSMLADARAFFYRDARLLLYPGISISLMVLAVNLLGDGLRRSLHGRIGER